MIIANGRKEFPMSVERLLFPVLLLAVVAFSPISTMKSGVLFESYIPVVHNNPSPLPSPTPSPTPPPAVYTPDAKSIVLSLSDMPSGYALNQEESGRGAPNDTYSDSYAVQYENWDLLFSGTPLVYNMAGVARSEQLARDVIQRADQEFSADPEYEPISCSTLGDETICYRAVNTEDDVVAYIMVFRKANLVEVVITSGVLGVAPFMDTITFAEIVLGKVDTAIGAQVLTHDDVIRIGATDSELDASNLDVSCLLRRVARRLEDVSQR